MILINLLPHREAARKRRREAFYAALGAAALAGLLISALIYAWFSAQVSAQQDRNVFLQNEIKQLESQIKEIATLESEIASLRARQKAVEDLQADRNLQVHLLNELVKQLPDGVFLTSLRQQDQTVTLTGTAQSNQRVSELLQNLANNTPWLSRPELVEIVAGTTTINAREQRRVANFNLRVRLMRSSEAQKAGAPSDSKS